MIRRQELSLNSGCRATPNVAYGSRATGGRDLINLIARNLLAAVGVVTSIAGLLTVLFDPTAEHWVKLHANVVYYLLLAVIFASFVAINYLAFMKRKVPSEHDREAVDRIFSKLPPDGEVVHWLRYDVIDNGLPYEYSDAIAEVHQGIKANIVGLDNRETNKVYSELEAALDKFRDVVGINTQPNRIGTGVSLGGIIDWKQKERSRRLVEEAQDVLVRAYDRFLLASHKNSLYGLRFGSSLTGDHLGEGRHDA